MIFKSSSSKYFLTTIIIYGGGVSLTMVFEKNYCVNQSIVKKNWSSSGILFNHNDYLLMEFI